MKRMIALFLAGLLIVVAFSGVSFAQSTNKPTQLLAQATETVRFARGATSAALTRQIPANGSIEFLINASQGQVMEFTVGYDFADRDITAYLIEPGMRYSSLETGPQSPNEFVLKRSGIHRLYVQNDSNKRITITLYLSIE